MTHQLRDQLIETVEQLPSLRECVLQLIDLASDRDSSAAEAARVLSDDGILTGRVLSEANSALSNPQDPVIDISEAVSRLGIARVTAIAMSASAMSQFPLGASAYGQSANDLSRHHRAAVEASIALGTHFPIEERATLTAIAVLHDIGKLVLSPLIEDRETLTELSRKSRRSIIDIEADLFDIDHTEAGKIVCDHWNIPSVIGDSIEQHHRPREADRLTNAVYIADAIAHASIDQATDHGPDRFPQLETAMGVCNIDDIQMARTLEQTTRAIGSRQ